MKDENSVKGLVNFIRKHKDEFKLTYSDEDGYEYSYTEITIGISKHMELEWVSIESNEDVMYKPSSLTLNRSDFRFNCEMKNMDYLCEYIRNIYLMDKLKLHMSRLK